MKTQHRAGTHQPATTLRLALLALLACPVARAGPAAPAPAAWRVTGISAERVLESRMGPGTEYPVNGTFGAQEYGLRTVTCVPWLPPGQQLAPEQGRALPESWCLVESTHARVLAGWVPKRFLARDDGGPGPSAPGADSAAGSGDASIDGAVRLVQRLYAAQQRADQGAGPNPLDTGQAGDYFFSDAVQKLKDEPLQVNPLYDAQDFDGRVLRVLPDPEQPMFRGLITVHVDFVNFGRQQRATYHLRHETALPGAPVRILDFPSFSRADGNGPEVN